MSEEFPDRNLDVLRARTASGRPTPYDIDEVIVLPREPQHDAVIEAQAHGSVIRWRSTMDGAWAAFFGPRSRRAEDWANIVEAAIRNRWRLVVRKDDQEPGDG